jgi:NAD(P)-dependent dehydrogenase (short-subunit alcohol dehydrogenase family)
VQIRKDWLDITTEEFDLQVKTNLQATLILAQLLVPGMKQQGWGRLLMIGSVQETLPHHAMAVYAATKNAQTSLVRNLAKQLAPDGITVNNIAPGVIDTDRNTKYIKDPSTFRRILERIPAHRCGQPEDCAAAAALLCSEAGGYITGTSLYIDGGMSL